jgi:hypothetical protein
MAVEILIAVIEIRRRRFRVLSQSILSLPCFVSFLLLLLLPFCSTILKPVLYIVSKCMRADELETNIDSRKFHTHIICKLTFRLSRRLGVLLELAFKNVYLVLSKSWFGFVRFRCCGKRGHCICLVNISVMCRHSVHLILVREMLMLLIFKVLGHVQPGFGTRVDNLRSQEAATNLDRGVRKLSRSKDSWDLRESRFRER